MKRFLGLAVMLLFVAALGSAQGIGLKAIGGEVGYNSFSFASESWGGFVVGAVADLGELTQGISLYPSVTYASASKTIYGADASVSDLAINANVKYAFKGESITPYVGAGLGLNFISSTVNLPSYTILGTTYGGGSVSASDTKIGINLLAGAQMGFGSMTGFAQAGYNLVSEVNHFQILVGVMVPMK